jgi:hypothetical protein
MRLQLAESGLSQAQGKSPLEKASEIINSIQAVKNNQWRKQRRNGWLNA